MEYVSSNKILIIDDEPALVSSIMDILQSEKYQVISALNGKDGLELFHKEIPGLVILDIKMPAMNGIEVLQEICLSASDPFAVIMMSGFGDDESIEKCFKLGISAFLKKPFHMCELLGLVKHSFELKNNQHELRGYSNELEARVKNRTQELAEANRNYRLEIIERKHTEKLLKSSLEEKDVLLKEVHHRVKNNLQIIFSLLKLQSNSVNDEKYSEMMVESLNRIKSMSFIHEKLYKSKDLSNITFNDYLKDLAKHLFSTYGTGKNRIGLEIDVLEFPLSLDSAIPAGLVINELLTNSLKYAFPGDKKGAIKITASLSDQNEIQILISDNGIGIPDDLDYRNTESLGLKLVTSIAEKQLGGVIELDRTGGTSFNLKFTER